MRPAPELTILLDGLHEAFDHRAWHGTNLNGSIRGITVETASWRPRPTRHNAWEIIVHAAYWKYAVARRLTGARRGTFPLTGSNWFRRPVSGTEASLRADIALLRACHRDLMAVAAAIPAARLKRKTAGSRYTAAEMLRGIAAHDVYHAGQIQLLKRQHRDHLGT